MSKKCFSISIPIASLYRRTFAVADAMQCTHRFIMTVSKGCKLLQPSGLEAYVPESVL